MGSDSGEGHNGLEKARFTTGPFSISQSVFIHFQTVDGFRAELDYRRIEDSGVPDPERC